MSQFYSANRMNMPDAILVLGLPAFHACPGEVETVGKK
jgi:hypothetical protein